MAKPECCALKSEKCRSNSLINRLTLVANQVYGKALETEAETLSQTEKWASAWWFVSWWFSWASCSVMSHNIAKSQSQVGSNILIRLAVWGQVAWIHVKEAAGTQLAKTSKLPMLSNLQCWVPLQGNLQSGEKNLIDPLVTPADPPWCLALFMSRDLLFHLATFIKDLRAQK